MNPKLTNTKDKTLQQVEDEHVLATYRKHGNNKAAAARALGVSTKTVYNRLKRLERRGVGT